MGSQTDYVNPRDVLPGPGQDLVLAAKQLLAAQHRDVLLVEDTAAHAALISRALSPDRWEIEHVTRGSAALEAFTRNSERIVLLDLSLPDCSGLELLNELFKLSRHASVVVVTSLDQVGTSVEAMKRGAIDYVVKSEPVETTEKLTRALAKAHAKRIEFAESRLREASHLSELLRSERLGAVEEFVRSVCREITNPLSGIMLLAQLLRENPRMDGDLTEAVEGILKSAEEIHQVVKKLKVESNN